MIENKKSKIKHKTIVILLILLIPIAATDWKIIQLSSANPISVVSWDYGALLPTNFTHGVQMLEANVIFDIDARVYEDIVINYTGDYSFYNPNITQTLVLGAPLEYYYDSEIVNIDVLIDGLPQSYLLVDPYNISISEFWRYFYPEGYYGVIDSFILCNVSFPVNETTSVHFGAIMNTQVGYDYNYISYIVGTANSWFNEKITESVEFRVIGKQPKSYEPSTCLITKISEGKSYLWNWVNETIEIERVSILYKNNYTSAGVVIFLDLILPLIIVIIVLPLSIYMGIKLKKKRKSRLENL